MSIGIDKREKITQPKEKPLSENTKMRLEVDIGIKLVTASTKRLPSRKKLLRLFRLFILISILFIFVLLLLIIVFGDVPPLDIITQLGELMPRLSGL